MFHLKYRIQNQTNLTYIITYKNKNVNNKVLGGFYISLYIL